MPVHYLADELQDMRLLNELALPYHKGPPPTGVCCNRSIQSIYAVHQMENQLHLYCRELGVFVCCMRQNDYLKLINTRQLYQGQFWQNYSSN